MSILESISRPPSRVYPQPGPFRHPDEILLQVVDHIDRGRATELLYWAASTSTAEVVEALLDAGADINKPAQVSPHYTPLMAAIARSATAVVNLLLEKGASTEFANPEVKALDLAVNLTRDPQIVEKVLQSGTVSLDDKKKALTMALFRRSGEYGGPCHAASTRVVRILATDELDIDPKVSEVFLDPWRDRPNWASLINEDEKESLLYMIGHGLDLDELFKSTQVHPDATLAHALLFHCWEADMPAFLARNLGSLRNKELIGGLLLRTLAAGCLCENYQGNSNVAAISALLENGVDPKSEDSQGWNPLSFWIKSLEHCSVSTKIEHALPTLAVLLDKGGVNPNRNRTGSFESGPIGALLGQKWTRTFKDTAVQVLVMLLSHFPNDMGDAPHWQLLRRDFPQYFPVMGDFERYGLDYANLDRFRRFMHPCHLSTDSSYLLLKAAYIVSMKKYLVSQFSADKGSRAYNKISFALNKLTEFGIPFVNFPTDFILDTISLVGHLEQGPEFYGSPKEFPFLDDSIFFFQG